MNPASDFLMSQPPIRQSQVSEKIHALTSLRFFAALYVVCYHSLHTSSLLPSMSGGLIDKFLSLGYVSVSFFFLLSGYILGMVYLRDGKPIKKKSFYSARFARIYPLFLCTQVADTPHYWFGLARAGFMHAVSQTAMVFSAELLMLQAWSPHFRYINYPSWSLSVEALFYLIFPVVGVSLWRLKGSALWATAVAFWVGSQLSIYWLEPHIKEYAASYNPLLHLPTFLLGILLARWEVSRRDAGSKTSSSFAIAAAIAFILVCTAAMFLLMPILPRENLNHGLMAPIFILTIWVFSRSRNIPSRIFSVRWLVVLGDASFGLYLIHVPVLNWYQSMHWTESSTLYATYLIVCIGMSVLSFYYIESPSRKWILKQMHTPSKETIEAASDAQ